MKKISPLIVLVLLMAISCTSQKKLSYLYNLPESNGEETFKMDIPDYHIQSRDILYLTARAMMPDGSIADLLGSRQNMSGGNSSQYESSQYLYGYDVNNDGIVIIPVIGQLKVSGLTLSETRVLLQGEINKVFKNTTVECKLLSYKFTVIGEVRVPGAYINYNNYLTVLEAIGRAGGVSDYGNRTNVLVVRPFGNGTRTYRINLQDKKILTSEGYFLLPNDIVIVQPLSQKIFNMNLPTFTFILTTITSTITMTLLLINYLGK